MAIAGIGNSICSSTIPPSIQYFLVSSATDINTHPRGTRLVNTLSRKFGRELSTSVEPGETLRWLLGRPNLSADMYSYYQSARLRWNSMERLRGPLEDSLVDDLVEWSMWHYATSKYTIDRDI